MSPPLPVSAESLASVWPALCQVCGGWPGGPVCTDCLVRFAPAHPRCTGCGSRHLPDGSRCPACRLATAPGPLSHCVVAVDYAYPWDGLLARFKFRGETGWARVFAARMAEAPGAANLLAEAGLIAPVPLTPQRIAERGHHPPWELVKALGPTVGARARPELLWRLAEVPDQHGLPRAQRLTNLRGVMAVHPRHGDAARGRRVLLVDDVTTTGATLQEAARALRQAGAAQVDALVFARTPGRDDPPL